MQPREADRMLICRPAGPASVLDAPMKQPPPPDPPPDPPPLDWPPTLALGQGVITSPTSAQTESEKALSFPDASYAVTVK